MAETVDSRLTTLESRVDTLMETLATQFHTMNERLSDLRAVILGVLALQAAQLVVLVTMAFRP
jgi:hypothetical protein